MIKTPLIAINFKTYSTATGRDAVNLTKICSAVAKQKRASILVAVQPTDIALCAKSSRIPVFGQHVDAVLPGAHTGHILPEALLSSGASGTLLNHSEDQYEWKDLVAAVALCKEKKLVTIVCADTVAKCKKIALILRPDFVAYEPPELIGGDVSVTTRPAVISKMVKAVRSVNRRVNILVGAGVKNGGDVAVALKLKTQGVLLASGVAANKDPRKALLDLCSGLTSR